MPLRVFPCRPPLVWGFTLLLTAAAGLRAESTAVISSPFLPPGAPVATAAAGGGPIEYHGYMVAPDGTERFSIYSTSKKSATWVGLNDKSGPYLVRSHRLIGSGTDQITVDYQGSSLVLALKEAKIVSVAIPAIQTAPVPFVPGVTSVVAPAVQGNPPNLPAGASLDEWAAEVQRRRLLRQQQPGQPNTNVTAPAAPAPAPTANAAPAGQRR